MLTNYDDMETITRMATINQQLTEKFRAIDDERIRNYNMLVSSLQWDPADKAVLDEQGRPANAYNLISPIIKNISGLEKSGRKKVAVIGVTEDDHRFAETMNKILDWSLNKCDFDRQKSRAFLDAIIGRFGWIYTGYHFDDDPEGMLYTRRINPFRIKFDTDNFESLDMKSCQYVMDSYWYTLPEILQMYALEDDDLWNVLEERGDRFFVTDPKKKKGTVSTMLQRLYGTMSFLFTGKSNDVYNQNVRNDASFWFDPTTGRFQVMELHERRLSKKMMLYYPYTNQKIDITEQTARDDGGSGFDRDKLQMIRNNYVDPFISQETVKENWITTTVPALNAKVQDIPYPVQNGNFMHTMLTAYDFHADITNAQSVVDELFDPQSDYNKRRSTILETIMKTSSVGFVMEEDANAGHEDEWDNPQIGGTRYVTKNSMSKWKQLQGPSLPADIYRDLEEGKALFPEISGVTAANRGMQEFANEPGKLFIAKREQGEMMLEYLFDNLEASTLQIARNSLDNIQHYMTEEREIRIAGDFDNPSWMVINKSVLNPMTGQVSKLNDVTAGKFDLEISQSPYGRNAREVEYLKLLDIVKFIAELNPQGAAMLLPILVKASDTPYRGEIVSILERLTGITEAQLSQEQAMKALQQIQQKMQIAGQSIKNQQAQINLADQQRGDMVDNEVMNTLKQAYGGMR